MFTVWAWVWSQVWVEVPTTRAGKAEGAVMSTRASAPVEDGVGGGDGDEAAVAAAAGTTGELANYAGELSGSPAVERVELRRAADIPPRGV